MSAGKTALLGAVLAAGLAITTWIGLYGLFVRTATIAFVFPVAFWGWVFTGNTLVGDPHGIAADALFILFCTLQGITYALAIRWYRRSRRIASGVLFATLLLLHAGGALFSLGLFGIWD